MGRFFAEARLGCDISSVWPGSGCFRVRRSGLFIKRQRRWRRHRRRFVQPPSLHAATRTPSAFGDPAGGLGNRLAPYGTSAARYYRWPTPEAIGSKRGTRPQM